MSEITRSAADGRAREPGSRATPGHDHPAVPIPPDQVAHLVATAARAPSVHNTQPWRFLAREHSIEMFADTGRRLHADRGGRELIISCGGALFGLRLGIRELGYLPVVDLLPEPARPDLLARVRLGEPVPVTAQERRMLAALPHRHTHRGPFRPGRLPDGLLPRLQHDALAEGATLALVNDPVMYQRLVTLAAAARQRGAADPMLRAETRRWSRRAGTSARDGVPAQAFPADGAWPPGRLPQRDFDLGRGIGLLPEAAGVPALATAVLITTGDRPADWLRAGQAMHRLLIRAAAEWVFASLYTQPLEIPAVRALIRSRLALPGEAQMLLQFGLSGVTRPTPRRAARELLISPRRRVSADAATPDADH
jgi:nitroreductase